MGKFLRQSYKGIVDGPVAVRVEVLHDLANDGGAFVVGAVGGQVYLPHGIENPACAGFQPVTYVWNGAIRIDTHRVGKV